jgi:hypothetical protein
MLGFGGFSCPQQFGIEQRVGDWPFVATNERRGNKYLKYFEKRKERKRWNEERDGEKESDDQERKSEKRERKNGEPKEKKSRVQSTIIIEQWPTGIQIY